MSEDWESVDVDVAKPIGTVISVRFPKGVAQQIFREAERRGERTSTIVREAVEAYLEAGASSTADVTISSVDATVSWYAGRSRQGRTASAPSSFEPAGV